MHNTISQNIQAGVAVAAVCSIALSTGVPAFAQSPGESRFKKVVPQEPLKPEQPGTVASAPSKVKVVRVDCPVQQVTVGVETPASFQAPWWDTPFVMQLDSTSTSIPVGGKPGLSCIYKGSGRDWIVSRPVAPDYQSCAVAGKAFLCAPK
jgi:hypothetical protein